jgi:hypothetical protein
MQKRFNHSVQNVKKDGNKLNTIANINLYIARKKASPPSIPCHRDASCRKLLSELFFFTQERNSDLMSGIRRDLARLMHAERETIERTNRRRDFSRKSGNPLRLSRALQTFYNTLIFINDSPFRNNDANLYINFPNRQIFRRRIFSALSKNLICRVHKYKFFFFRKEKPNSESIFPNIFTLILRANHIADDR